MVTGGGGGRKDTKKNQSVKGSGVPVLSKEFKFVDRLAEKILTSKPKNKSCAILYLSEDPRANQ